MPHVILQSCCNDASCVPVCPVDCIHPRPDEPEFMRAEMLHIDPEACIDCGACVDECPVSAILPDDQLEEDQEVYLDLNADYFENHQPLELPLVDARNRPKADFSGLRVAIVGSGPSAFYAASELVAVKAAEVNMFDRLLIPYGLARFGVAPDHLSTKAVTDMFRAVGSKKNFDLYLGVEIGEHLSLDDLRAHHDAVVYAVGASSDRRLGIDGEDLPGSHAATDFVGWYNGHPDHAGHRFDLSGKRAVIVGNGNVALDVARMLLSNVEDLEQTDMAQHAIDALRESNIREVTLLGRRGVAQAAYTNPEMIALMAHEDIDVVVDAEDVEDPALAAILDDEETPSQVRAKVRFARDAADSGADGSRKRLVLRFLRSPVEIVGGDKVTGIRATCNRLELGADGAAVMVPTDETELFEAGLVFRAVGYRGTPVAGLPFDTERGVIPNEAGRVIDSATGDPLPGVYVTGWIKRGPTGVIGTNKKCATETVDMLLQDFSIGVLSEPTEGPGKLDALVAERRPSAISFADWAVVDKAERKAGRALGRPRVKFVDETTIRSVLEPADGRG